MDRLDIAGSKKSTSHKRAIQYRKNWHEENMM